MELIAAGQLLGKIAAVNDAFRCRFRSRKAQMRRPNARRLALAALAAGLACERRPTLHRALEQWWGGQARPGQKVPTTKHSLPIAASPAARRARRGREARENWDL